MRQLNLKDICSVNDNKGDNSFVGIVSEEENVRVQFPLGFRLSNNDNEIRKDILLLINTIAATSKKRESEIKLDPSLLFGIGLPIQSFLYVIKDYVERGYYRERENEYVISKRGKINWHRTIKNIQPVISNNHVYYLDFVTKRNVVRENELITLIHKFCVKESFDKIGWLFTNYSPEQSTLKFNKKLFLNILSEKMERTFNDKNRELFRHMIAIINEEKDPDAPKNYQYGTNRFEYVWEGMIDQVYGIADKEQFFPRTSWSIRGRRYGNASLEPDSIMLWNNNIYVLDAKYYRYGKSRNPADLPASASANKQITYGEYVDKIKREEQKVYNAFLMPFDSSEWGSDQKVVNIGECTSDWKSGNKGYERIQGILVDVKYLMKLRAYTEIDALEQLAESIESAFSEMDNENGR